MFSKSNYTAGLQCPKILWMDEHMPSYKEEELVRDDLIKAGHQVGELARQWADSHVCVEQTFDFEAMALETAAALQKSDTVCEATFYEGGLVCMVDIFRKVGENRAEIIEVKAATKTKPYHVDDATFQTYVVEKAGYQVDKVWIMHLNPEYRLNGELNLEELFVLEDISSKVRKRLSMVETDIVRLEGMRYQKEEPSVAIGRHCNSPHACPYQCWCWREVPEKSIFNLAGMGRLRGMKHWENGANTYEKTLQQADFGELRLNDLQRAQIKAETGKGDTVDKVRLSKFLDDITFPLYFLDFETIQPAVPEFQGTRCYQQIPTQFSLHWLETPDGELHHAEYLAPSKGDPRRGVAEALIDAIPTDACVTAYNMSFEKGRIKEMANAFNDLFASLMAIHDNIVDLMIPFQKGWAYKEAMGGSYSIKKVLPAIWPNDPELNYDALTGVHNGAQAMEAFAMLKDMEPGPEALVRQQLLEYCKLDTLAMVKVWQWLKASDA